MSEDPRVQAVTRLIDATQNVDGLHPTAVGDALDELGLDTAASAVVAEHVHRAQRDHARMRRREHELSALFSSSRELAELRDVDAVLSRLVQRAHEMMAVDLAYLSEFDPRTRELQVRVTSGSVSEAFRSLRVPPGRGLASVVVENRGPQWVSRYDQYSSDRHEDHIDSAVAGEGIVALLGVPMLTSDDVLGVLFVAMRQEKEFTPEEISLLSALADHASVTLQTTQLLDEVQRAADETRQALETQTAYLAERDRANNMHQELVKAVLAGGGFSPVTESLASSLERAVALVDANDRVIAASGMPLSPAMLSLNDEARAGIAKSKKTGQCILLDVEGISAVSALTAGSQCFGAIVLGSGERALDSVDLHSVERAAQVAALIHLQQEAASGADHRLRSELVADLLDDIPERRPDVERRARRLGIDVGELDTLLLLAMPGDQQGPAARELAMHLGERALVGEYRGAVVALFPEVHSPSDTESLRAGVSRSVGQSVIAVVPSPPQSSLPAAFADAMRTARLVTALGAGDVTVQTAEYLPYAAVLDTDPQGLAAFIDATIGKVRRYDAERNTDLLGTLRTFIRNNASPTRTARALSFHTNTILQRIERLDHVLGKDWRNDERMFRIGVAVRLDELRARLTGQDRR